MSAQGYSYCCSSRSTPNLPLRGFGQRPLTSTRMTERENRGTEPTLSKLEEQQSPGSCESSHLGRRKGLSMKTLVFQEEGLCLLLLEMGSSPTPSQPLRDRWTKTPSQEQDTNGPRAVWAISLFLPCPLFSVYPPPMIHILSNFQNLRPIYRAHHHSSLTSTGFTRERLSLVVRIQVLWILSREGRRRAELLLSEKSPGR